MIWIEALKKLWESGENLGHDIEGEMIEEIERLEKALAHTEQLWREEREKNK